MISLNTNILISSDRQVINIVKQVVEENELCRILVDNTTNNNGSFLRKIKMTRPDLLILDFDLTAENTIKILKLLYEYKYSLKIIVIISNEDFKYINDIYKYGVFFVIPKPIYYYELLSIINNVYTSKQLEDSLFEIQAVINKLETFKTDSHRFKSYTLREEIYNIFSDLGIIGEIGCKNLIYLIELILDYKQENRNESYLLQSFYISIALHEKEKYQKNISPNAIEQRIRRLIQKALTHISECGLNDFGNPNFDRYSSYLFDFQQVRREMDFLKGNSSLGGKINIRKFAEGIIVLINN